MYINYYTGNTKERESTILHGRVNLTEHGKTKNCKETFHDIYLTEKSISNQHRYQFNIKILIR